MDPDTLKHYLTDDPPTIVPLDIKPHFEALSPKEKLYAHHVSVACFSGQRALYKQTSPESEAIHDFIIELHKHCKGDWKSLQTQSKVDEQDIKQFLNYAAQFLGNGGNFKSFGDTKFVPRILQSKLEALAKTSPKAYQLFEKARQGVYSANSTASMSLGYPDEGHITNYYPDSPRITKKEISAVSDFFESKKLLPENTRMRKTSSGNFEILIASSEHDPPQSARDLDRSQFDLEGDLTGKTATLVYGDYSTEMGKVAASLGEAKQHAANSIQEKMMDEYVKSFTTGSCNTWKASQASWIQDKQPTVETDIGFIETYRDPHGIRGEWEGFVAMVNKERTQAFQKLVESAPEQIPKLPWSKDFEKDKFLAPDFTSLEVLTFAGSGIPAGINIPNYDDIRQNLGFKNVSLGNVLSAKSPTEVVPFIHPSDLEVYKAYRDPAFEVQVGLHELLGHGCGKLLQETSPGSYNFDHANPPTNPLTSKPIDKWYKPGQTWGSIFGALAGPYEECRAECVAMALCCDWDILRIFGFDNKGDTDPGHSNEASDVLFASYLSMARAGVAALEFWDPYSKKWGQPHMQARFSILRTFLDAGGGFCTLSYSDENHPHDLTVRIDRSKIISHGRPATEDYLTKLQVYKATADFEAGKRMFDELTDVSEWMREKVRPVVLSKKQPRKVFVQANTVLEGGQVVLKEYESTPEGMVKSWAERPYV
ncbi:MAG: hypothetical protein Q9162_003683 [Coniocarpon cinnabarinum]